MSLRTAAALAKGLAADLEGATTAAKAFPGVGGVAGLPGGGGPGIGAAALREALAPLAEAIDAVRDIVDVAPGGFELAERRHMA